MDEDEEFNELLYNDEEYDEEDREQAAFEQAIQDCGQNAQGTWCSMAGTEYCDFQCPFRKRVKGEYP